MKSLSVQNALFELFNGLSNSVFWIRSTDYRNQLFVSKGYESVWGYTTQSLYEDPDGWFDTLDADPHTNKLDWFEHRTENDYTSLAVFRIRRSDGTVSFIKDQSCVLVDDQNQRLAIIGVGESITEAQRDTLILKPNEHCLTPSFQDFGRLICQEWNVKKEGLLPNQVEPLEPTGKFIMCGDQRVWVSRREFQVLELLIKGLSAKQTAWELGISVRTVETYLNSLRKKTGARTKLSLIGQLFLKN